MIRPSRLWQFLALLTLAHAANAQTNAPPPKLERIEEIEDSAITVTPKSGSQEEIAEKREQGRVVEAKVSAGGSTYYVKPYAPAGTSLPGDILGSANRGPQWQVLQFNLGKSKQKQREEEADDNAPAPPPPNN